MSARPGGSRASPPVECVWPVAAALGEGPVWDAGARCLWFADIKQGRLHRYDPAGGTSETVACGTQPCFVLPADDGGLVIGDGDRLLHWRDGQTRVLGRAAIGPRDRLNDATVDPRGRIWFGSMDDGETDRTGRVHRYDRGTIATVGGPAVITNGPAISGDGRWLYHVDTLERLIWRFDIAREDRLTNGEPFVRIDPADGTPDGVTIDAEDHVWVGLWGGWAVRRYAPDGRLDAEVRLPCANVTKLAFGGPDLRTAFVTTARIGLDGDALAGQPLAGGLFAFRADVPGRLLPAVAL